MSTIKRSIQSLLCVKDSKGNAVKDSTGKNILTNDKPVVYPNLSTPIAAKLADPNGVMLFVTIADEQAQQCRDAVRSLSNGALDLHKSKSKANSYVIGNPISDRIEFSYD